MANSWQGEFPWQNLLTDGYEGTSPVGSFPPNGYGLYDMVGNVWEWTSSLYRDYPYRSDDGREDPRSRKARVARGGSWYAAPQYLRASGRLGLSHASRINDVGFRCARDGSP